MTDAHFFIYHLCCTITWVMAFLAGKYWGSTKMSIFIFIPAVLTFLAAVVPMLVYLVSIVTTVMHLPVTAP